MKTFNKSKEGKYEVAPAPYRKVTADEWRHDIPIGSCRVPIVTALPKHEKVERIGYQVLSRLKRCNEIIHDNVKGKFKTLSDVYRSAHYIGTMILMKMHEDQIPYRGKAFYEMMTTVTAEYDDIDMIDMLIMYAGGLIERIADGSKIKAEVEMVLAAMLTNLPADLQPRARARLQKLCVQLDGEEWESLKQDWEREDLAKVADALVKKQQMQQPQQKENEDGREAI